MKVAFSAVFLVFCLLGTHAIGFSHSIAHAHFQNQTAAASITADAQPSLNHSSDVCHLFDALSLAVFVGSDPSALVSYSGVTEELSAVDAPSIAIVSFDLYQSRAPPAFHI